MCPFNLHITPDCAGWHETSLKRKNEKKSLDSSYGTTFQGMLADQTYREESNEPSANSEKTNDQRDLKQTVSLVAIAASAVLALGLIKAVQWINIPRNWI